jgi:hypothetical protein
MLNQPVDIGDLLRVDIEIKNAKTNTLVDPTTLILRVLPPVSAEIDFVYLTDVELVRDSKGKYHVDLPITESGKWQLRWKGTGAAIFGEPATFNVQATDFPNP